MMQITHLQRCPTPEELEDLALGSIAFIGVTREDMSPYVRSAGGWRMIHLGTLAAEGRTIESQELARAGVRAVSHAHASDQEIWYIDLAYTHMEAIRSLADEFEYADAINFPRAPRGSPILIDSSGQTGWMVADAWGVLMGSSEDLGSLCSSLASVGRKRELRIAGRIKMLALKKGAPAELWEGEIHHPNTVRPSRTIESVAKAWKDGQPLRTVHVRTDGRSLYSWSLRIGVTIEGKKVAIDYRRKISSSTSCHVGIAIQYADFVLDPGDDS